MSVARGLSIVVGAAVLAGPGVVAEVSAQSCDGPIGDRAPDPRCGENLDGRVPADPPASLQAARAALAGPRVVTQAVLWPVVKTSDAVERYRVIEWMRAIMTTDDGKIGVRPAMIYSTSFTPTVGARLFFRRLPGEGSEVNLQFQSAGPDVMMGQFGVHGPEWLGLSLQATWNRRNDRLFAGIGPNRADELSAAGQGIARYGSDNLGTELRWFRRLPGRLELKLRGDFTRRNYQAGDVNGGPPVSQLYGEAQLPGFDTGMRLIHGGGGLALNLRDNARDASGVVFAVDGAYAHGVDTDPSRHGALSGEAIGALGGRDKVFLLRARAMMVERFGAAPVPFEELVMPSGRAGMRGFPDGRFRGESGLIGTAEYRWYIAAYLDAALFVDVGTVAGPRFSHIDWERWFPSFGLGFRFYRTKPAYWESPALDGVQIAYSPEGGARFLLTLAAF